MTHPSPQGAVPEGAYVGTPGQSNSVTDQLNNLDENGAKAQMQGRVSPSFNRQRDANWGLLDMLLGRYTGDIPAFVDGQLELNERFDLLAQNAGHGAAYMTKNYWMGTSGGGALGERGKEVPFRAYLGPHKNCELVIGAVGSEDTGHWRLLAPGTWRADLHVTANSSSVRTELIIEVCAPDGTAWHRKLLAKPGTGSDEVSEVMATKFVVPASGYTVHARRTKVVNPVKHRLQGGTERSAFILTREDLDATDHANEPTVPDGPDIG